MLGMLILILNIIFYVIEFLLLLRFILILFSANLSGTFARWIFANSSSLVAPFDKLFPTIKVAGLNVDLTLLFALVVYAIIGQLIIGVLQSIVNPRNI